MNQARTRPRSKGGSRSPGRAAKLLASHRKDARRSWQRMRRSPLSSLMTSSAIAVALLLPALLLLLNGNLGGVLDEFQNSARITLYLKTEVAESRGIELSALLNDDDAIELTDYISPDQAMAEFSAAAGIDGILDELASNPLPAAIVVQPVPAHPGALDELAARLGELAEVDLVQLDSQWLLRLRAISDTINLLARLLGVIVVAGLCVIVSNTIKLEIDGRRDEIRLMKQVGAANSYIARPFLYSGLLAGLSGGLLACLLLALLVLMFQGQLTELALLYNTTFRINGLSPGNALLLTGTGGLIGWVAALLAAFRHLATIEPR